MCKENGYKRHDGSHYYYHLVDGGQDLLNHGIRDQDTLTGYFLHDAKEDIPDITTEMIAEKFNPRVAMYMDIVTKNPKLNYRDPKVMEQYLYKILQFLPTSLIKVADRKHNFSTLEHASPEKELRVANETELLYLPFLKMARLHHPEQSAYFHSAKTEIMPHLKKIKKYHADINALHKDYMTQLGIQQREIEDLKRQLEKLKGN
ncbi:HD domain-containing protein [Priestia aryabhattai]|uniref:HD domain-containing protein n=1 Tax=Priestia aryabhattai TaxID=412384 RepID=UPI00399FBE82